MRKAIFILTALVFLLCGCTEQAKQSARYALAQAEADYVQAKTNKKIKNSGISIEKIGILVRDAKKAFREGDYENSKLLSEKASQEIKLIKTTLENRKKTGKKA